MGAPAGREQLPLLGRRLMRTRARTVAEISDTSGTTLPESREPLIAGFLANAVLRTQVDERAATPQGFGDKLETDRHDVGNAPWHSHLLLCLNVIPTSPLYPVYSSPINPVYTLSVSL